MEYNLKQRKSACKFYTVFIWIVSRKKRKKRKECMDIIQRQNIHSSYETHASIFVGGIQRGISSNSLNSLIVLTAITNNFSEFIFC